MKPRLLLDIDGVCADFLTPFINRINVYMGTNFKPEDMNKWNCYDSFDIPDYIRRVVDDDVHKPGYCRSLKPLPGAVYGVSCLKEFTDIYVVTSPWTSHPTWEYERRQWIKEHLGIDKNHVISTSAKYCVKGDILIDDKIETLDKWRMEFPAGLPICFRGPANNFESPMMLHTNNWSEILQLVRQWT